MKLQLLKQISGHLSTYTHISHIKRFDDNVLKITFDSKTDYYFDLTRGQSAIFIRDEALALKSYAAPFDKTLNKFFNKSRITHIGLLGEDKILRIAAQNASSYKSREAILQLEFTGKNTNAIILDQNETVIDALRHVGEDSSFRIVKPGKKLLPIPPREFTEKCVEPVSDLHTCLRNVWFEKADRILQNEKKQALSSVQKRISKLESLLDKLENEEDLQEKSIKLRSKADIILANLGNLNSHDTKVQLSDFEGNPVFIEIPSQARDFKEASRIFYDQSRRARNKAENIHIEKDNLISKINFQNKLHAAIERAVSINEVHLYIPKKRERIKKEKKTDDFESFFIEGTKISIGRNERENILLLKYAKADDTWLHLKDHPSSHVIIHTGKQNPPQSVLDGAARLCVEFSATGKGTYLVDYTKRRHVRMQEGANVLYTHYKTLTVTKE